MNKNIVKGSDADLGVGNQAEPLGQLFFIIIIF